jgi:hypothetical protein
MKKTILILFLFSISYIFSQSSVNASGNSFTASSGSFSYSLGQMDFIYFGNANTVIYLGVQQPKVDGDIAKVLDIVDQNQNIVFTAYPNPTFDSIKIHLSNSETTYHYFLFDTTGKRIKEGDFKDSESIISLENFPTATYYLKVISGNGFEKNIKIIKNEK